MSSTSNYKLNFPKNHDRNDQLNIAMQQDSRSSDIHLIHQLKVEQMHYFLKRKEHLRVDGKNLQIFDSQIFNSVKHNSSCNVRINHKSLSKH